MFKINKTVNFYDCDPAGIMFFARVYEFAHAAYETLIHSFHLSEDYWANEIFIVPIIKSEASYHQPMKYGESIEINIKVLQLKKSSFELEYLLKNERDEKCTVVKTVHVFVDKKTWKKTEMPDYLFQKFSNYI